METNSTLANHPPNFSEKPFASEIKGPEAFTPDPAGIQLSAADELEKMKSAAAAETKRIAAFSNRSIKRATLLFRDCEFQRAEEILRCVDELLPDEVRHLTTYGNALAAQDLFAEAEEIFRRQIALEPGVLRPVARLADMLTGQGKQAEAADVLQKFMESTAVDSNLKRRIQTHRNLAGIPNSEIAAKRDEALNVHKNEQPLSPIQEKVLADLRSTGIAITSIQELFGTSDLWKSAEDDFRKFSDDSRAQQLAQKISRIVDFKDDPELSKLFKPSVINYKNFFGDLTLNDAIVRIYSSDEILGIANSYNGMASKIRNMHLWINPPLHTENVNGRKGSQLWHRDQEDSKILKCFIYFSDIDEKSGATDYVKNTAIDSIGLKDRILPYPCSTGYPMEKLFYSRIDHNDFTRADGKKGTIVFLDTNGFHRGGFVKEVARHIAMCTFLRPISPYVEMNTKVKIEENPKFKISPAADYGLR